MRHEWKPFPTSTTFRASDEDSDIPGFWQQRPDGSWRALLGEVEEVREMLRLAARVQELEGARRMEMEERATWESFTEGSQKRLAALEEENAILRAAFPDLEMHDAFRKLRERVALLEADRVAAINRHAEAVKKLTLPGSAA